MFRIPQDYNLTFVKYAIKLVLSKGFANRIGSLIILKQAQQPLKVVFYPT